MATIEQVYRDNLRLLIKDAKATPTARAGTLAAFAEALGKSPAQVSQWVNASVDPKTKKPRVLSRQSAREIERKLGKAEGWMDRDHSVATEPVGPPQRGSIYDELTEDEHEMLLNFRQVTDKDRVRISTELASRAEELREYLSQAVPHLPMVSNQASKRAGGKARAVVEAARRRPMKTVQKPTDAEARPDEPELPLDHHDADD